MLNKYKIITITEGEFCKIIVYKICVPNQSFILMKKRKESIVLWTDSEAFTIFKCFSISTQCNDVITQYWMYFLG